MVPGDEKIFSGAIVVKKLKSQLDGFTNLSSTDWSRDSLGSFALLPLYDSKIFFGTLKVYLPNLAGRFVFLHVWVSLNQTPQHKQWLV